MTCEDLKLITDLQGKVNRQAFLDRKPGHLLVGPVVANADLYTADLKVRVVLTEDKIAPWNDVPGPDGKRRPAKDSKGRPLYEPAVFPKPRDDLVYEIRDRLDGKAGPAE